MGVFVSIGGTGILFHLLVTASKETMPSEELMLQLHLLLAKVGPKGRSVSHLNRCTHHSAGFKTYALICETIVFSFPSNCLSNPTDFVSVYIGENNLKIPSHPSFNVCLSRQKVWREGSAERSSQRHCQLNQTKPA